MFILPNLLLGVAQCLIALFLLCSWYQYLTIEVLPPAPFVPTVTHRTHSSLERSLVYVAD